MSYTPVGLFNHTAAIYQMLTGYTADKVSPSGQLEPPTPEGLPDRRLANHPAQAADRADAAVRDDAAAACRSRTSSARAAAPASSAGPTTRTRSTRPATTWTWPRWTGSRSTTCSCGRRCRHRGWNAGPSSANVIDEGMPELDRATAKYDLDEYYGKALGLVDFRPGPQGVRPGEGKPDHARAVRQEHVRPVLPAGPATGRGRHALRRGELAQGRQLATTTRGTFTPACRTA